MSSETVATWKEVRGSPLCIGVIGPYPPSCVAEGSILGKPTVAGHLAYLMVELRTDEHQPVWLPGSSDELTVSVFEKQGRNAPAVQVVKTNDKGRYAVQFTPTYAGEYTVAISVFGEHIHESPFALIVAPAEAHAFHSKAFGAGLARALCADEATFIVAAHDRFGNQLWTGGDDVRASLQQGSSATTCLVRDNNDGLYGVGYVNVGKGCHDLHVSINGIAIQGSPFAVFIESADPPMCIADGEGLRKATAGEEAQFTVHI
jgi:hypothetical protein